MNQNNLNSTQAIYDAKSLGKPKLLLLGLQHAFAMFGATVLVPMITGLDISTTLLVAGIGTLLFHFITGFKVPAFLGSSFAYLGGFAVVSNGDPDKLPYACGAVAVSGLLYVLMSLLFKTFGAKKIMKFFPPVVTGPIIISIGLILAPSAINNSSTNWLLAGTALLIIILCNIFGKGMVKIIPIMLGIVGAYALGLILFFIANAFPEIADKAPTIFKAFNNNGDLVALFDFSNITNSTIARIPLNPNSFAKFSLSSIITIAPIAIATMMEHIGDISAIGATTGKNYISNPGLHKTLLGDGLATSLAGLAGGPANTTYGENTGVLALTKVYDPLVMRIAALVAIFLSFFPIVANIISSIPTAIIGGVSLILYGMISAIGIRNISENKVDLTVSRNLIIVAVILVSALGFNSIGGITFHILGYDLQLTGIAISAILGILLNAILPGNDYEFNESNEASK